MSDVKIGDSIKLIRAFSPQKKGDIGIITKVDIPYSESAYPFRARFDKTDNVYLSRDEFEVIPAYPTYKDEVYDVRGRSNNWDKWCKEAWDKGYRFISHYNSDIETIYRLDSDPEETEGSFYTGLHSWLNKNYPTMGTLIDRENPETFNVGDIVALTQICPILQGTNPRYSVDSRFEVLDPKYDSQTRVEIKSKTSGEVLTIFQKFLRKVDEMSIETKVLEYLQDPKRSNPNELYTKLGEHNFFGNTEEEQRKILNDIMNNGSFCKEGKQRFRDHMGDLLDEPDPYPKLKGRATVTLAYAGSANDDIDQVKIVASIVNQALKINGYTPRIIVEDK